MKKYIFIIVGLLLVLAIAYGYCSSVLVNQKTQTCEVTGKESVYISSEKSQQYRVYSTCGTFVVEDSLVLFRFNSADVYGKITTQQTYTIHSGGLRIPFLTLFPNVISATNTN